MANGLRVLSLVCATAAFGCVDVPEGPKEPSAFALDGALASGLSADGGPARPPTGAPYTGPECEPAQPHVPGGQSPASGSFAPPPRAGSSGPAPDGGAAAQPPGASAGAAAQPDEPDAPRIPRPSAPGDIVITELMSNPEALRDDVGEWFELYNPSDEHALSLEGCAIDDGTERPRALPGALVIEPLGFAVIARSDQVAFAADLVLSFSLGNSEDRLALICGGVEIDRVSYGAGYPLVAGASLSLDPGAFDALANDDPAAWCAAPPAAGDRGSPGAPNPDCLAADAGAG